jgi:D-alanine transaminase
MLVYLNGDFIEKSQAKIPVTDRGFLFGDGVYEVIPVYQKKPFRLVEHLARLQKSLNSILIQNPHSFGEWQQLIQQLISYNKTENQSIYLQITRGAEAKRKHSFSKLSPCIYLESNPLASKSKTDLFQGVSALSSVDIRWQRCDIKSTSLLANVLYAQQAKENNVEEIILHRENIVTEGATSNIFKIKDNILQTHPAGKYILSGITRDLVLESARFCQLKIEEKPFSLQSAYEADELWISSSTREIMPIIQLDNRPIKQAKVGKLWTAVYQKFQLLKNV